MPIIDSLLRHLKAARRAVPLAIGSAAAALMLAACGSDNPADSGDPLPSPDETSSSTPETGNATTLKVSESDFSIKLSKSTVEPGEYTFAISNDGNAPHNLAISGPGVDQQVSDTFQSGKSGELAVSLEEGTYTVWCAVGTHRAQGMETTIKVTG